MELRWSPQRALYLSLLWETLIGHGASSVQGVPSRAQNAKWGIIIKLLTSGLGFGASQDGWSCNNTRKNFLHLGTLSCISTLAYKINLG